MLNNNDNNKIIKKTYERDREFNVFACYYFYATPYEKMDFVLFILFKYELLFCTFNELRRIIYYNISVCINVFFPFFFLNIYVFFRSIWSKYFLSFIVSIENYCIFFLIYLNCYTIIKSLLF